MFFTTKETSKEIYHRILCNYVNVLKSQNVGKEKECYRITLFCKEHLIKFYNKNGFEVNSMAMKLFPK